MDKPRLTVIGTDRCDNLRWKGIYIDPQQAETGSGGHIFWCLQTQIGIGPDGKLVDKYECNPGRSCYKPL